MIKAPETWTANSLRVAAEISSGASLATSGWPMATMVRRAPGRRGLERGGRPQGTRSRRLGVSSEGDTRRQLGAGQARKLQCLTLTGSWWRRGRWRAGSRSVLLRAWSADGWEGVCWQAGALNVSELSELDEAQAALLCRQPGCRIASKGGLDWPSGPSEGGVR
jgi:hypothetical protein